MIQAQEGTPTTLPNNNKLEDKRATTRKRRSDRFSHLTPKRQNSGKNPLKGSLGNPYSYPSGPKMVAQFHRDEIVTGQDLSFAQDDKIFAFYDVCGIDLHEHTDATDKDMTDFSASNHDEGYDMALHHRQFPSLPTVARDEEEARQLLQAQIGTTTITKKGKASNHSKKTLHKYMIKQVHPHCSNRDQAIAHLAQEVKFWKKASHKHHNLLTLRASPVGGEHVFGSQWDSHFLLTDRVSETLAVRLSRWKTQADAKARVDTSCLGFRLKLVYAENLANVLRFLHSKKIAVRNLCPESIGFLASDDTLQLMNLGQAMEVNNNNASSARESISAATMLEQQNEHPLFQMTPGGQPYRYMAPELLTTRHTLHVQEPPSACSTNVDSYSWAMICFEMLTLHRPYGKMKAGQHLRQVGLRVPSLRPNLEVYQLPHAIECLLKGAWRQDATRRLEADQIDKRLKFFLQEELHKPSVKQNDD